MKNTSRRSGCCKTFDALQRFFLQAIDELPLASVLVDSYKQRLFALRAVYESPTLLLEANHSKFCYNHYFSEARVTFTFDVTKLAEYQNRDCVIKSTKPADAFRCMESLIYEKDTAIEAGFEMNQSPIFLVPFFIKSLVVDGNHRLVAHMAERSLPVNYCIFPVSLTAECLADTFQQDLYRLIMDLTNAVDISAL